MFYNSFRSTSKETMRRNQDTQAMTNSKSVNPREKLINIQKREKLKGLLITKFMKKYGIKNPEKLLQDEISKFLEGERLTDADLRRLDEKLRTLIGDKDASETLKRNLSNSQDDFSNMKMNMMSNLTNNSNNDVVLPDLNKMETMSVHSKQSRMSGGSHLSKFNELGVNSKHSQHDVDDFDSLSISSNKKPLHRFDFSNEGDEWNAICIFNQKKFEEEKKLNKLKDLEVKRRTKDDLDKQIIHKLKRMNEEQMKNFEYDNILLNHTDYLNEIELQKQMEAKAKVLKEKENRDKQMRDEKIRKRTELHKEKKYDKELVKHLLQDIENEKQKMIKKKTEQKDALQKILKDNELNKIKQLENMKKEREDDVRYTMENAKMLEKDENERKEYFNKIERNAKNFMSNKVGIVLKDMDNRNKEEEERMKNYLADKEIRDQENDEYKKRSIVENKKMMKSYLDMQVDEKRKMQYFEKTLDSEQARIWKMDTNRFHDQEKDINYKVRMSNTINADYLKSQIEMKKGGKFNNKMSETEYALNRRTLENLKMH